MFSLLQPPPLRSFLGLFGDGAAATEWHHLTDESGANDVKIAEKEADKERERMKRSRQMRRKEVSGSGSEEETSACVGSVK